MRRWGTAPNSSVKVTHISKQCFTLGQLDGSLWAGTKMVSGRENCLMPPAPVGTLHSGVAHPCGPPSGYQPQTFLPLGHLIWQP